MPGVRLNGSPTELSHSKWLRGIRRAPTKGSIPIFSPSPARRRQQRPTGKTARKRTHAYVRTDRFGTTATALITCICLLAGSFLACSGRDHDEVLVITNSESPASVAIGEYYAAKRGVPRENIVKLKIPLWDAKLQTARPKRGPRALRRMDKTAPRSVHRRTRPSRFDPNPRHHEGHSLRIDGETSAIDTWLRDTSQASVDAELSLLFPTARVRQEFPMTSIRISMRECPSRNFVKTIPTQGFATWLRA